MTSDDVRQHQIIELLFRAAGCPSNSFLPLYDDEEGRQLEMLFLAAGPTRADKLEILRKKYYIN
jgi:hypothetical protein